MSTDLVPFYEQFENKLQLHGFNQNNSCGKIDFGPIFLALKYGMHSFGVLSKYHQQ
jgi:hypothetical protein